MNHLFMNKIVNNRRILFLFFFLTLLAGIESIFSQDRNTKNLLYKTGELRLPLQEQSTAFTLNIHVYRNKTNDFLFIEQTFRGSIDVYNLATEKLFKTIHFPQSIIQEQPNGFVVYNMDSIYILLTKSNKLALLDGNGHFIRMSVPLDFQNGSFPIIFTNRPVIILKNKLILSSVFYNIPPQTSAGIIYDIENDHRYVQYPVSEIYRQGWWGTTLDITTSFFAYNDEKQLLVISFPVDDYIYVYDTRQQEKKYYAASTYIKKIKPYSRRKQNHADNRDILNHFARSGYYSSIFYDKYQEIYYRYLRKPIDPGQDFTTKGNDAIIILDKTFNILGEWEVPAHNDLFKSFIDNKGLYIFNTELYRENPDTLYFDIYHLH